MNTGLWITVSTGGLIGFLLVLSFFLKKFGGYAPGWRIRCAACNAHRPAAEAGIVRVAAMGTKHTIAGCPSCGKVGHAIIERDPGEPATIESGTNAPPQQ